jgi:hypothetical protein
MRERRKPTKQQEQQKNTSSAPGTYNLEQTS